MEEDDVTRQLDELLRLDEPVYTSCSRPCGNLDYAVAGQALLNRVNLRLNGAPDEYDDSNPIYHHSGTGAKLFVGNFIVASSKSKLRDLNVTRIVFCQDGGSDGDGQMLFSDDPEFTYLPFPIGRWSEGRRASPGAAKEAPGWHGEKFHGNALASPESTITYFAPLFNFVETELNKGNHVLIHCLAGAHRAGTAGIACLMHICKMDRQTATAVAQAARPAIDPIGDFPELLSALERAQTTNV